MKKNSYLVALGISISLLLTAVQALAQGTDISTYAIPFGFHAGNVKLPAGQYIVKVPPSPKGILYLESPNGARHATLLTVPFLQEKLQGPSKLVFNQYGTAYFLSKAWDGLGRSGQELIRSKAEKEYRQQARIPKSVDIIALVR